MYNRLAGQMEIQYDTMRYTPKSSMATKFQVWVLWLSSIFSFPRDGFQILGLVIIFFREVRFKRMAKCSFWWMHPWNFLQEQGVPIRISFQAWMDLRVPRYISGCSTGRRSDRRTSMPFRSWALHEEVTWRRQNQRGLHYFLWCGVCLFGWLVGCGLVGSGRVGFGLVWFGLVWFGLLVALVWFGLFVCWLVVGWLIS